MANTIELASEALEARLKSDVDDDKDEVINKLMTQVKLLEKLTTTLLNDSRLSQKGDLNAKSDNDFPKSEVNEIHSNMSFLRTGDQIFLRYEGT
jgi:K+-sensing histidine kinase KdpD